MIGNDGQPIGKISRLDAIKLAREGGLDLVEVGATASPPVCRIVDYGKYRYEQEKNKQKGKARNKAGEVKEIRLGVMTDEHDFNTRVEQAKKFLGKGHKIRLTVKMLGRQNIYADRALGQIEKFRGILDLEAEAQPQRYGPRFVVILTKKKVNKEKEGQPDAKTQNKQNGSQKS